MIILFLLLVIGGDIVAQPPPPPDPGGGDIPIPGSNAVGTLPGSFSVSPSGAATYAIPIDLPPGRAGMTPQLAFVYNNHTPSTIMGQGWGISGFSSIGRVNPTLYYNDEVDNVDFTDDQLILDGNRLIDIGTEGSNKIYRTEVDGISKIIYHSSGEYGPYFEVKTKSGLIKEYGNSTDSRQTYNNNTNPLFWHLNKIYDQQGNSVEYTYTKNTNSGELHPSLIQYTLFEGGSPNLSSYIIEFAYSQLDDEMHQTFYFEDQNGDAYLNKNIHKLEQLLVKNAEGGEILKQYDLVYESEIPLAGEYCLESITLSASDNGSPMKSFNPTTFEWNYYAPQKGVEDGFQELESDPSFQNHKYVVSRIDIDGDGIDEMVDYFEEYTGSAGDPNRTIKIRNLDSSLEFVVKEGFENAIKTLTAIDIDNDGRDELMVGLSDSAWIYRFENEKDAWTIERIFKHGVNNAYFKTFTGDFTGDGLVDMLLVDEDLTTVEAELFIGTGIAELNQCFQGSTYDFTPEMAGYDVLRINALADFNGDGKTDIALEKRENVYLYDQIININYEIEIHSFTENGFEQISTLEFTNGDATDYTDNILYADFNGDGRTDVHHQLIPGESYLSELNTTYHSYGKGFMNTGTVGSTANNFSGAMFISDQNNDGRADRIYINYYYVANHGSVVTTRTYYTTPAGLSNTFLEETIDATFNMGAIEVVTFADLTGNGVNDIILGFVKQGNPIEKKGDGRSQHTKLYSLCAIKDGNMPATNVITGITNGFNVKRVINYQSSRNTYQTRAECSYPLALYKSKTWLVNESYIEGENGNKLNHQKYTFNTPIAMLRGKGFLGFQKITVFDYQQNTETVTDFSIYHPNINGKEMYFLNSPRNIIVKEHGGSEETLSRTVNEIAVKETVPNEKLVFLHVTTKSTTVIWDNDDQHSLIKTVESIQNIGDVDIYGNSEERKTITSGGGKQYTTEVESEYIIDVSNWIINRPDRTTITKTFSGEAADTRLINYTYYDEGDAFSLLKIKTVKPNGSANFQTKVEYEYDTFGNIGKETVTALGDPSLAPRITEYSYATANGYDGRFLTEARKAFGVTDYVTQFTYYTDKGKVYTKTDPSGLVTTYTYDEFNRLLLATYPDGTTNNIEYDWAKEGKGMTPQEAAFYTSTESSGNAPVISFFDKYKRELRQVTYGLEDNKMIYHDKDYYQTDGRLQKVYEPYFSTNTSDLFTEYEYDALGRPETKTTPANSFAYDYKGLETSATDNGTDITKTTVANILGTPATVTDPTGTITYNYFSNGKPKNIDALGSVTSMLYDAAGNQKQLNEPNAGITTYVNNAFGELVEQTDARQNKYQMAYDIFGRLITKTLVNTGEQTNYYYNNIPNREIPGMGFGKLGSVTGPDNISYSYDYDGNNRLIEKTEIIEGQNYTEQYSYNTDGKLETYTYPSDFSVTYGYSLTGHLKTVTENEYDNVIWEATDKNDRQQLTDFTLGNGLSTHQYFDENGFPKGIVTGAVQHLEYEFNAVTGNLTWRKDMLIQRTENFEYDNTLQIRLTSWQVDGQTEYKTIIKNNGNILSKTDATAYSPNCYNYNSNRPHAVTDILIPTSQYENSAHPQTATYTAFNKVETMVQIIMSNDPSGSEETRYGLDIMYGPDNLRKKVSHTKDRGILKDKYYIGANYEIEIDENGDEWKYHYIKAENGIFAIYKWGKRFKGMYYIHKDHLGSFETITNEIGSVEEKLSFDPWGRRRNPTDWTYDNVPTSFLFDRGYTGHEHLDNFDLINMNGRIYDPWLGRFLSPDPFVQAPTFSQSYNRYTYAFNNPLKYVDPTGYYGGRYGPPAHYAYGEGSASPGMGGAGVVYGENGQVYFGYGNMFGNTGLVYASTETMITETVTYDKDGNPIYNYSYSQGVVYKDKSGNAIGYQEYGQADENSQNDDGNNDKKPRFSEISDSKRILIIINAIRNARLEGKDYIDLNDLFEGPVGEGNMITTIKIGDTDTEVFILIANHDDKIISVYGSDTQKGPFQNRYFKGHIMNGYWKGLKYDQYNDGEHHSDAIEVMWILFDGNNTDVFYKYIHPKP